MQQTVTVLLSSSLLLSTSVMGETQEVSSHNESQLVLADKDVNTSELESKDSAHQYKVQFQQKGFYQVEHIFSESKYGSMKETEIYFVDGNDNYLVSKNEFTKENIIPTMFDGQHLKKLDGLPFQTQ